MPNRDRVIKKMESLRDICNAKSDMAVGDGRIAWAGYANAAADALALLREQEPVKPEFDSLDGNVGRWRCGSCQVSLGAVRPQYCWHCGKRVKWDA